MKMNRSRFGWLLGWILALALVIPASKTDASPLGAYPVGLVVGASAFGVASALVAASLHPAVEWAAAREDWQISWDHARPALLTRPDRLLPFFDLLFALEGRLYIEVSPRIRLVPSTERLGGFALRCDF